MSKGHYFMDILSKLPKRLKELMEEAEISTPALAQKINLDHSEISKFLRGDRLPSTTTLVTLADYFNCTTDYLIGLSDDLDERTFKQRPPFNEQLSFLLKYFNISKYRLEKETKLAEEVVNRWHKGKYEPNIESLIRIANALNCSVDFVLGRES